MRLILGLDRPSAGRATVNGRAYRDLEAPLHEVGALLEARAIHTGRSAYNHLLAHGPDPRHRPRPRRRGDRARRASSTSRASASAGSRSAWASGSASPLRCSATRGTLILDEPANGLDPEGIRWIRNLLKQPGRRGPHGVRVLAPDERDRAHRRAAGRHRPWPADRRHLGRGVRRAAPPATPPCACAAPTPAGCATLLAAQGAHVEDDGDALSVSGSTSEAIGRLGARGRHRPVRADRRRRPRWRTPSCASPATRRVPRRPGRPRDEPVGASA